MACSSNSVRADYAEEYVFTRIKEVLINEKMLKDIVANINKDRKQKVKPLSEGRKTIEVNLQEAKGKKDRVFDLYEEGRIDKATLSNRIKYIDDTIQEQEKELERINKELQYISKDEIPFETVKDVMSDFGKLIDTAKPEQRKLFLQLVIDKITVTKGKINKIDIYFNETIRNMINMYSENKGELSDDESSSSSFVFKIAI